MVFLLGFLAYGPDLATTIGGLVSDQVTKPVLGQRSCPTPAEKRASKNKASETERPSGKRTARSDSVPC
jgi:hypothetical protein